MTIGAGRVDSSAISSSWAAATDVPADFSPGGEHVIVGTSWLGDRMRAVVPWFTRGLLWGRVIVPGIGWVWTVLAIVFLISLLINQVLHGTVSSVRGHARGASRSATFLVGCSCCCSPARCRCCSRRRSSG